MASEATGMHFADVAVITFHFASQSLVGHKVGARSEAR